MLTGLDIFELALLASRHKAVSLPSDLIMSQLQEYASTQKLAPSVYCAGLALLGTDILFQHVGRMVPEEALPGTPVYLVFHHRHVSTCRTNTVVDLVDGARVRCAVQNVWSSKCEWLVVPRSTHFWHARILFFHSVLSELTACAQLFATRRAIGHMRAPLCWNTCMVRAPNMAPRPTCTCWRRSTAWVTRGWGNPCFFGQQIASESKTTKRRFVRNAPRRMRPPWPCCARVEALWKWPLATCLSHFCQ